MPSRQGATVAVLEVMFELLAATPRAFDIEAFVTGRESRVNRLAALTVAQHSEKVAA